LDGLMGAPANIPPPPPPIISEALPKSAIPIEALLTGAAMAVAFAALISWVVALTLSKTRLADLLVKVLAGAAFPVLIFSVALFVGLRSERPILDVLTGLPARTYLTMVIMFAIGWWIAGRTLRLRHGPIDPKVFS